MGRGRIMGPGRRGLLAIGAGTAIAALARPAVPRAVDETPDWSLRGEGHGLKMLVPDGRRCLEPVPLDQPGGVVGVAERQQRLT